MRAKITKAAVDALQAGALLADTEVKVYSNQSTVSLRVNGVDLGERAVEGHITRWQVKLAPGANRVEVRAGTVVDSADWQLIP